MTDSRPRRITKSAPKTGGKFRSAKLHPNWSGSNRPDLVGRRFGQVEVISEELRRIKGYIHLLCKCLKCGAEKWIYKDNLLKGKTGGCQSCTQTISPHSDTLGNRYDDIYARCNRPGNPRYPRYGGRGIELRFKSRKEFILWVSENLPHPDYRGVEIDRIDNDGHYEPGNLRLATRRENTNNREVTLTIRWKGRVIPVTSFDSPYSPSWTAMLATKFGLVTGEMIIKHAQIQVRRRRCKSWRKLRHWLDSRGYTTS